MHNVGWSNLREKWVKVALEEDSFIVSPQFWDANGSWKDFLESKKCKWPSLERFINLSFANEELRDLHLCLHAPKLDVKGASVQVIGASSLAHLTSELVEADFLSRGRLADTLTNWVTAQALLKDMGGVFSDKFGDEVPIEFTGLSEVLKVLISSLFAEVKTRTEDFFKARKACRARAFVSCPSHLRADLLLKSSPFSVLLFQQSVVDTVLAELRTADKDPATAFGKKFIPKGQAGSKGQKRKKKGDGGRAKKAFHKDKQQGGNASQGDKGGRNRKRGVGKGKDKSAEPKPSTSSQ